MQPGQFRSSGGPDGAELTAKVDGHLDYLSQLAKQLGVHDPVESYLVPVLGRWSDLHDEAGRWRSAAQVASSVTSRLTAPLAGLDAAWQGADADSFLEYMHNVGLAGHDLADALGAMADALDKTADGIRQIAGELVDMLADTAEQSSDAMTVPVAGAARARQHLDELDHPGSQLYESVRDVLDAFGKLCNGVQGGQLFSRITMSHKMPTQNWTPPAAAVPPPATVPPAQPPPAVPPAAVRAPAAAGPPASTTASATPATHRSGGGGGGGGGVPAHAASAGAPAGAPASGLAAHQTGPPPESGAVATPSDSTPATVPGSEPPAATPAAAGGAGGGGMPMGMGGM
ncbi:MAG TPA: WXG100 family type VII secretion target, partial [Pseudonocardiaceae bacterium]